MRTVQSKAFRLCHALFKFLEDNNFKNAGFGTAFLKSWFIDYSKRLRCDWMQ